MDGLFAAFTPNSQADMGPKKNQLVFWPCNSKVGNNTMQILIMGN